MRKNEFAQRHNGPTDLDVINMLKTIGVQSLDELISKTIPNAIRLTSPLDLPDGISENQYLSKIKSLLSKNKLYKSFIGMGFYNTNTPSVILRNIFENPTWYTSYTPYQAEISQGRLEALLNYQTMISELTAMPVSNASLLDEATAVGEMMLMFYNSRSRESVKNGINKIFVSEDMLPYIISVVKTNAAPLGIEVVLGNPETFVPDETFFSVIVPYINQYGKLIDYSSLVKKTKELNIFLGVNSDLLVLSILVPPGEWGADCVAGSTQRFGIPMGFGGPSAAYFACKDNFVRQMPGRIIGLTIDAEGDKAIRMALQTREQHIKREKATSNICTASALTAIMAGFFGMWHGHEGLKKIATSIHNKATVIEKISTNLGYKQHNKSYFDTVCLEMPEGFKVDAVKKIALENKYNFRYYDECDACFSISIDETTKLKEVNEILSILASAINSPFEPVTCNSNCVHQPVFTENMKRSSTFMEQPIFNEYHSETAMMRYIKKLEEKDLSLNRSMIPLGSCTMKLNSAAELLPLSWAEACSIHPFVPADQAAGYIEMIKEMEEYLCKITGFKAISFQPNSGAAGEYAGLIVIRNYHIYNEQSHRNVCLIPASAHGTNPASAIKAGNKIVVVKSSASGEIDVADLKEKAELYKDTLSCLMVTYPSTHGVFEEKILEIIDVIHQNGGLVYMDGANMNAQVGLTSPGFMGADVCHLNLHKTFAMPHGGGGPGVGPIGVSEKLVDFLPKHDMAQTGGKYGSQVASAPYGSAYLLPITYGYMQMLGGDGMTKATKYAILNANYLRKRLENHYKILYTGATGMCAHEMILDCNEFEKSAHVFVGEIAKRLMDYGFHAPTVAFPVHGTLMVEPTESEPLSELDRLCDALISIRKEIKDIEEHKIDANNNPVKNAPHTMKMVCSSNWDKPYSREIAAFPSNHEDKYWPSVAKIDDAYGDRNLKTCNC